MLLKLKTTQFILQMIKSLELTHARCFGKKTIQFQQPKTYMYGDNGVGKTTILEAIHLIATTKSHRTNQDKEFIQHDHPFSKIVLETNQNSFEMVLTDKGKRVWLNGVEKKKLSQFIGHLNIVMFAPEDVELVKGAPLYRRQFLDISMIQTDTSYLDVLNNYKKILKQRNALLKKLSMDNDLTFLNILSEQLIEQAIIIINKRHAFVEALNELIQPIAKQFDFKDVIVKYEKDQSIEGLKQHLFTKQKVDILSQVTTSGPHKDDITVYFNHKKASQFASQGQQRLLALSLKLSVLQYLKNHQSQELVLLLDDVLSELDETHQQQLLNYEFKDHALIINSTQNYSHQQLDVMYITKES